MKSPCYPKAEIKWPVSIKTDELSMDAITMKLNPNGAFLRCSRPLKLHEVFEMTIDVPNSDLSLETRVEVIWSNIYGPDDEITPRGMGVRFLNMSSKDRQVIAKEVLQHIEVEKMQGKALEALQTIAIHKDEIAPDVV